MWRRSIVCIGKHRAKDIVHKRSRNRYHLLVRPSTTLLATPIAAALAAVIWFHVVNKTKILNYLNPNKCLQLVFKMQELMKVIF